MRHHPSPFASSRSATVINSSVVYITFHLAFPPVDTWQTQPRTIPARTALDQSRLPVLLKKQISRSGLASAHPDENGQVRARKKSLTIDDLGDKILIRIF